MTVGRVILTGGLPFCRPVDCCMWQTEGKHAMQVATALHVLDIVAGDRYTLLVVWGLDVRATEA